MARRVHLASLALGFFALLWMDHRLWFGGDEWAMVSRAAGPLTLHNLFAPHNEHWSTAVIVEYRVLLSLFGLRTYIPYLVVLIAAQILVVHLIWRLMLRAGVDEWIATVLSGVFIVLGSGAQALQNAFNVSFVAAVAAGAGALLVLEAPRLSGRLRVTFVVVLLLLGLMCGPPAIAMVFAVGLLELIRRGWRSALGLLSVPVILYAAWFAAIGHEGTSKDSFVLHGLPSYLLTGLASVFALNSGWSQLSLHLHLGGATAVGTVLAIGVAFWLFLHRRDAAGPSAVAFVGAGAYVFFYLVVAVGRTRFGASQAAQTRYVYVAVALLLPLFGVVLTSLQLRVRSASWAAPVSVGCVVLFAMTNVTQLYSSAGKLADDSRTNEAKVLGTASLIRSGSPVVEGSIVPSSSYLTTATVRAALSRGWFGSIASVTPSERLDARSVVQVSVTERPEFDPSPVPSSGVVVRGLLLSSSTGACTTYTSSHGPTHRISFDVPSASSLGLETAKSDQIGLVLVSEGSRRMRSPVRTIRTSAGRMSFLNFLSGGFRAQISVSNRSVEVCSPDVGRLASN